MNNYEEITQLVIAAEAIHEVIKSRENRRSKFAEKSRLQDKLEECHTTLLETVANIASCEGSEG